MRNNFQRFLMVSVLLLPMFAFIPAAQAAVFTDVFTFVPNLLQYGSSQSSGFSWLHDITDNIGGNPIGNITLLDASLTVSHDDTGASELWTITGLGNLASSNNPTSTVFNFNAANLADLQADGLFTAFLTESTSGSDSLLLFTSTLSGHYDVNSSGDPDPNLDPDPSPTSDGDPSAPEPVSGILFGAGLGLAALGRFGKRLL